jgi:hypothetical protein
MLAKETKFKLSIFCHSIFDFLLLALFRDLLDNLDLPALLENVVPSVKLAQWVLKVPL